MDTRISPGGSRADVIASDTATRVTPSGSVQFRDMVARGASAVMRGAEAAVRSLPGAPIVAAAVRPGGGSMGISGGSMGISGGSAIGSGVGFSSTLGGATRPGATGSAESPTGGTTTGSGAGSTGTGATGETSSVEGALAQSQEFNLYYLQLQEQLSAENRAFSTMSNVLKTRHDTVKNAIGNIR